MRVRETVSVDEAGSTLEEAFKRMRDMAQERIGALAPVVNLRLIERVDSFVAPGDVHVSARFHVWREASLVEAIDRALAGEVEEEGVRYV